MTKIILSTLLLLLGYAITVTAIDWLSLPVVAFNYEHECQWIQMAGESGIERHKCPTTLPKRYDWYYTEGELK